MVAHLCTFQRTSNASAAPLCRLVLPPSIGCHRSALAAAHNSSGYYQTQQYVRRSGVLPTMTRLRVQAQRSVELAEQRGVTMPRSGLRAASAPPPPHAVDGSYGRYGLPFHHRHAPQLLYQADGRDCCILRSIIKSNVSRWSVATLLLVPRTSKTPVCRYVPNATN